MPAVSVLCSFAVFPLIIIAADKIFRAVFR